MAELAAITGALNLLQEALALVKQACSQASEIFSAISTVESRINRFTRELNVMQAFLKHIDTNNQSNDILAAWIKEVRKVKDQIIDILDEFTYQVNKQKVGSSSGLKRIFKEPMSWVALKKLSNRVDEVDNSLKHLDEMKSRYSITNFGNSTSRNNANEISVQVANSAHFIDESEMVGIDENRTKLTSLLNSEDYLKDCFLYCCMFPEDYPLARKKLIRLWIAEDFVERRGGSTLEETAEGYLLELINRNMLQVVEKNDSGRVKRCRMHDTLRELAISLCMKNKFGLLYGDNKPIDINKSVRRLSIINYGNNIGHYVQLPQLQTLMSFDLLMHLSPLVTTDLVKCRHLTVLNLENLSITSVPDNLGDLYNLRYLGLRNTKVGSLPKSIRKLAMLQTLDLCKSEIRELLNGIVHLTKLRHLLAESVIDNTYKSFRNRLGMHLTEGLLNLKELQTLQSVESNAMVVGELGKLTQLRSLGIRNVNESHSAELCRSLSKMPFLYSLYIFASNENQILHLNHLDSPSLQLRKLWLFGQLKYDTLKSPLFQISGKYIQQLYLGWSELTDDPLPMLAYLENLTSLFLNRAYRGRQLSFRAGWFPQIKKLGLTNMPNLKQVEMKHGTMESIETIVFQDLKRLMFPQGVEHLSSLKSILCDNLSPDFGVPIGVHKFGHFNCIVYE